MTLRCKKINERKVHSIDKLHSAYASIQKSQKKDSGVIILQYLSLPNSLMNILRKSLWDYGKLVFLKNTLFKVFLKNYELPITKEFLDDMYGYNMVFFGNNFLQSNHEIHKIMKNNQNISERLVISCGTLNNEFFSSSKMNEIRKYSNVADVVSVLVGLLRVQQIQIIKILMEIEKIKTNK
ncbi:50S ribosomal protein L10 [Rickettsiales bacterium (ex Bugula neritina AB1)]|nr:50S ribosomal protein L10 [Rickettsiales bacterium (ex Bugula neritina AB1)]